MITKGKTHHPHLTSKNVGVLALKRLKCTGTTCAVFKTVVCAKCHFETFASKKSPKATKEELKNWANCIRDHGWDNAGKSNAKLKATSTLSDHAHTTMQTD